MSPNRTKSFALNTLTGSLLRQISFLFGFFCKIENEYANVEGAFHEKGASYIKWAGQMAVGLKTGVPWIMCKSPDAPDPVVRTGYLSKINHQ